MTHHTGDLIVSKGNLDYAKTLTSVSGSVEVWATSGVSLPKLDSICGSLEIHDEKTSFPLLRSIAGGLTIAATGAYLPALSEVSGKVVISADSTRLPALKAIGGSLAILGTGAEFPRLVEVARDVYVGRSGAKLPVITTIGGFLDIIYSIAMPQLSSVGMSLVVRTGETDLPHLKSVGGLDVSTGNGVNIPMLNSVNGHPWRQPTKDDADLLFRRILHAIESGKRPPRDHDYPEHRMETPVWRWAIHIHEDGERLSREYGSKMAAALALLGLSDARLLSADDEFGLKALRNRVAAQS